MKKGLIRRFLYGSDQKNNNLPTTRYQLFIDTLKNNIVKFMILSFILLLSIVPMLVIYSIMESFILSTEGMDNNLPLEEAMNLKKFSVHILGCLFMIIPIIIFSCLFSGIAYVIRRFSYSEGIMLKQDFFYGLKHSLKNSIVSGLIIGLSYYIFQLNLDFFMINTGMEIIPKYMLLFVGVFQFIIILIFFLYAHAFSSIYDTKISTMLKYSFYFTFIKLPKNLFIILLLIMFVAIFTLSSLQLQLILVILYTLFFGLLYYFAQVLYFNSVFDKYINNQFYKELVNKGIYENKDDE